MFYSIARIEHKKYKFILEVTRDEIGKYKNPFQVFNAGETLRRVYLESDKQKLKFLVDGQVLTLAQFETWANEEYKALPKCQACAAILTDDVFTHHLAMNHFFCSQTCSDKDYLYCLDRYSDEEECDYL